MFTMLLHGLQSVACGVSMTVNIGGREYPVVKIGNQLWMAENLDYAWEGLTVGGATSETSPRANYYNDDEATFGFSGLKYGLLYNPPAVNYLNSHRNTLLPEGWRVPSWSTWIPRSGDIETLIQTVGGYTVDAIKSLKSTSGWFVSDSRNYNGTDLYGFNACPTGYRNRNGNYSAGYISDGNEKYGDRFMMYSSTKYSDSSTSNSYLMVVDYPINDSLESHGWDYTAQYSLRLVKDVQ